MPAPSVLPLWRSVRHTPLPQLLHRLRLETRRRCLRLAGSLGWQARPPSLAAVAAPPKPLFPPRMDRVRTTEAGAALHFLNVDTPSASPLDWRPEATQLHRVHLHYMEYLEGLNDADLQRLVLDWIQANPPCGPGYWRDSWNSYALALRCLVWMQQFAVRDLPAGFLATAQRSLAGQLAFLAANLERDLGGNHLVKDLKTLLWARRYFHGAEAWAIQAEVLLDQELDRQILADGHHFERSPAYHLQVFADLLECHQLLADGSLKVRLGEKLDAMAQVAVDLRHPDGLPSLFNDGGLHMAYDPDTCLQVYSRLRGGTPTPRSHFALAQAGYFGLRGPGSLLLVDCGPIGPDGLPAHGHGDLLAFEWSACGRRLLVDAGVFEYQEGPRRAYSRSTRAHNTLTLDGADQAEFWKSFRVGRRPRPMIHHLLLDPGRLELEGSHDGYANLPGRPIHRRRLEATHAGLVVRDRVVGGAGQRAEARLLLHPDLRCEPEPGGARIRFPEGELRLRTAHPFRIEPVLWWPDFGVELPTTQLVLDYGPAPTEGGFVLELADRPGLDKLVG